MSMVVLACEHSPKQSRIEYACKTTGNYLVELCKCCRKKESTRFLVREEVIQ